MEKNIRDMNGKSTSTEPPVRRKLDLIAGTTDDERKNGGSGNPVTMKDSAETGPTDSSVHVSDPNSVAHVATTTDVNPNPTPTVQRAEVTSSHKKPDDVAAVMQEDEGEFMEILPSSAPKNVADKNKHGSALKPNVKTEQDNRRGWSQNSDSSAFMTPPPNNEDPIFTKKRKQSYSSFVASLKKRKVDADGNDVKKTAKDRTKKLKVKVDPDHAVNVKAEADEEMDIVPRGSMRPKDQYLYLMRQYVPYVEIAFNELSTIRSTAIAYLAEFDSKTNDNDISVFDFTVVFENILFVRQPEEVKEKWMTPEGKRASQLRRTVMRSCLSMARKNLFHDFANRDAEDMENADVVTDADGNPVLPIWFLLK